MTNKMPKAAYQFILGLFMLSVTAVACNNKKDEKKDPPPDTATIKPADPLPTDPISDTAKRVKDSLDKIDKKPVKDPPPGGGQ